MKKFLKSLYLRKEFFILLVLLTLFYVLSHFETAFHWLALPMLLLITTLSIADILLLYFTGSVSAKRITSARFSLNDENIVEISVQSKYKFQTKLIIVDELPIQFQKRDFSIFLSIKRLGSANPLYVIIPKERGEYVFKNLNILVSSPFRMIMRKFIIEEQAKVKVYPSYVQMRKLEFLAFSQHLTENGLKRVRRVSSSQEFDHIREYVKGDDYRIINWRATARKNQLMVNQYEEEKSQAIYNIIDTGRNMEMPFEELALVDYAINATLAFSNIALKKQDKAGILCFSTKVDAFVKADKMKFQIVSILEELYKISANFKESNYNTLYSFLKSNVTKRSLIVLYTNFEGKASMRRQLKYLKGIAKRHVVLLVFFQNKDLNQMLKRTENTSIGFYKKLVMEKVSYEKYEIVRELKQNGIHSILTEPDNLSISVINKYLEFKAKGVI